MVLTKLEIRLMDYGPDKGKHVGLATFSGGAGQVTLNLNDHHIDQIFETCADSIITVAKGAALHMVARVIEHKAELEPPK